MLLTKPAISKYLAQHAEPESLLEHCLGHDKFDHCLVIPAFQENWSEVQAVWHQLNDNFLVILVVNSPVANDPQTHQLLQDIEAEARLLNQRGSLKYLCTQAGQQLLLVDRCSSVIPGSQGVGLARKIGADIALKLMVSGCITQPTIFNTDADVILPADYFASVKNNDQVAAYIYPFRHQPQPQSEDACYLYEISMFYYVIGLKYAGSAYAFSTVGSTLAISAFHYAQVRGFPKRTAGEDFYVLNKLAKTGSIKQLLQPTLTLSGRLSNRVTFGTGIGIQKILSNNGCEFYDPQIFVLLKKLLETLTLCAINKDFSHLQENPNISHWCDSVGLIRLLESKKTQRSPVFLKFIHDWMDAFRTLKFIHFMRDNYYPSISLEKMVAAPFLADQGPFITADLLTLRNQMQRLSLQN